MTSQLDRHVLSHPPTPLQFVPYFSREGGPVMDTYKLPRFEVKIFQKKYTSKIGDILHFFRRKYEVGQPATQ
jgi:aminoglycoside N3'-acetyltransferase